jgi:hypothetical protein
MLESNLSFLPTAVVDPYGTSFPGAAGSIKRCNILSTVDCCPLTGYLSSTYRNTFRKEGRYRYIPRLLFLAFHA